MQNEVIKKSLKMNAIKTTKFLRFKRKMKANKLKKGELRNIRNWKAL